MLLRQVLLFESSDFHFYMDASAENASKSIQLLCRAIYREHDLGESLSGDPESKLDSSDVERSVILEHRDEGGGFAISTCAVDPLLSTNFQRPRSRTLQTTGAIFLRSTKRSEFFVEECCRKLS